MAAAGASYRCLPAPCLAQFCLSWAPRSAADFQFHKPEHLSIRSDGRPGSSWIAPPISTQAS